MRERRIPCRYRQDTLPEPPPPAALPGGSGEQGRILPRVLLIVRDTFTTCCNKFGIRRVYLHRPSYDPDVFVASSDLATPHLSTTRETIVEGGRPVSNPSFTPHCSMSSTSESSSSSNKSISLLLDWQNDGDNLKSDRSLNKLVENVLLNPHFRPADLIGFNTQWENRKRLDAASK
ncbi:hypothetical protein JOM56_000055, partial [Amanita muscaria]